MFKYPKLYSAILVRDRAFRKSFFKNLFTVLSRVQKTGFNRHKDAGVIIISLTEHMGDVVAAEPIAAHLRKQFPGAVVCWCVNQKYAAITRYNPALDLTLTVTCIAEWILLKKIFARHVRIFDLHIDGRSCNTYKLTNKNTSKSGINIFNYLDHGSLLDVFAISGKIKSFTPVTPVFHFSTDKSDDVILSFEYIFLHTTANDNERNWHPAEWNRLVQYLLDSYPQLHIVEIGLAPVISNSSARFHDLTRKYNLQQIAHIMKRARIFIGVESGFAHFANAIGTQSVVMIGHYQHYRNYQVYSGRFASKQDVILHYHPGRLCDMNYTDVVPAIEKQLSAPQAGLMHG